VARPGAPGALSVHLTDFEWRKEIGESKVTTASIAIEVFADARPDRGDIMGR
jgi:hypothetical protein